MKHYNVAILGGGSIGMSIAQGLVSAKKFKPEQIVITRQSETALTAINKMGYKTTTDNVLAVKKAKHIFVTVRPNEIGDLLKKIKGSIKPEKHVLISVVTGVMINDINRIIGKQLPIIRVMPNTAIAIRESMTCLSYNELAEKHIHYIKELFDCVGKTQIIPESEMNAATSLCACGVAFFLRGIRAAAQGGIEIGFHSDEAIYMAAQTALGAAKLLLSFQQHPEQEIDKVTTPKGCTIAGLNQMEHEGFSSAIIKGIKTSAEKAGQLFPKE